MVGELSRTCLRTISRIALDWRTRSHADLPAPAAAGAAASPAAAEAPRRRAARAGGGAGGESADACAAAGGSCWPLLKLSASGMT